MSSKKIKNIEDAVDQRMHEVLDDYFKSDRDEKRFVNISRVPLICQSIIGINKNLTEINKKLDIHIDEMNAKLDDKYVTKESFSPVQKLVYGFVALALSGIIIALLSMVIIR